MYVHVCACLHVYEHVVFTFEFVLSSGWCFPIHSAHISETDNRSPGDNLWHSSSHLIICFFEHWKYLFLSLFFRFYAHSIILWTLNRFLPLSRNGCDNRCLQSPSAVHGSVPLVHGKHWAAWQGWEVLIISKVDSLASWGGAGDGTGWELAGCPSLYMRGWVTGQASCQITGG